MTSIAVNANIGIPVSGRVTDQTGAGLEGVSVQIKGTNKGTVTDKEGAFHLEVDNENNILVFSLVGYQPQESMVGKNPTMMLTLVAQTRGLEEVVVVGYGTQKKANVTGSISTVKSTDLEAMPVMRVEQSLQGRTSGLTIASASGAPGSSATVRIRGTTSINNSDPLYIVDGVPIDIGGIDYLNQSDIESIDVLKDAASAAIYGTRAASGVILITTKKGKAGSMRVGYNGYYGTQAPARKLEMLNAKQYATLRNESSMAAGNGIAYSNPDALGVGTDWQSAIFNNSARIQDHELSISGGNDKSTYYASFGFFNQEGIVATDISKYKRFTVRLNSTHKVKPWLNFGNNLGYSHIRSQGLGNTNSEFGGPLSSAINLDPLTPIVVTDPAVANAPPYSTYPKLIERDANGNPYGISQLVGQEMTNPLAYIKTRLGNYGWSDNFVGNVYVEIEPVKGLKFRSSIGAKLAFYGSESFTPLFYLSPTVSNQAATVFYRENNKGLIWNWDNTVSYNRSIGDHNFTVLVGTGAQENSASGVNATYNGLQVSNFHDASMNYSLANTNRIAGGFENQPYTLASYFGRVIYDYAGKYLFTGIIRRDGSSKFGSNNKYGNFPSASLGWIASKEEFWPANNVVSFLKVRGSYGVVGNDLSLADFQYVSTVSGGRNYVVGNNSLEIGVSPNAPANPSLKWEQTSQTDIGLDAVLYKYFNLTVDFYQKKTSGMLRQVAIPAYVGATGQPYGNVASLEDKGFEVELGYNNKIGAVNLNVRANASYVKNTITNIGTAKFLTAGTFQASAYEIGRTVVGQPIASFYGFKTLGIFQTQGEVNSYVGKNGQMIQPNAKPGDFKWADLDGNGSITADDRTFIGDPTPHWAYGFTATAAWKEFDIVAFGQGVAGNKIFQGLRRLDILKANYTTAALKRWTGPGTSNDFPRLSDDDPNKNFSNPSSFYLEDGSYFRIKTIQIGYTLPASLTSKAHLQKLRVYVSGNNLVTFTKYSGFDPEIGGSSYSIDRGVYPQARSFMAGVNLTF
ncbi:MAG: TonB-dependent receptor [Bacteroidetes bacterium]|nr:TonB-dependent receptor [Bacteroidota bacterium]